MSNFEHVFKEAGDFLAIHLKECCIELIELEATGVLRHGNGCKIRALELIIAKADSANARKIAVSCVNAAALRVIANVKSDQALG